MMAARRINSTPAVRQAKICDLLSRQKEASVEILASKFNASQETIRRDLSALADAGRVQKIHGGARRMTGRGEGLFNERMNHNRLAKHLIAEKVARFVLPRQSIFMDTGSTTLICSEALARIKNLTVVTNSTRIAATFSEGSGGANVYLLGGEYNSDNCQTIGPSTVQEIKQYRMDHAILTVGAIDEGGAMDYSNNEAQVARAMIFEASKVSVLADQSKFGQSAPFNVCGLETIDRLVVDKLPKKPLVDALALANVEVVCGGGVMSSLNNNNPTNNQLGEL